jgi:hypothetical protein
MVEKLEHLKIEFEDAKPNTKFQFIGQRRCFTEFWWVELKFLVLWICALDHRFAI